MTTRKLLGLFVLGLLFASATAAPAQAQSLPEMTVDAIRMYEGGTVRIYAEKNTGSCTYLYVSGPTMESILSLALAAHLSGKALIYSATLTPVNGGCNLGGSWLQIE